MTVSQSDHLTSYELTGERLSPRQMRVDTGDTEILVGRDANPVEFFLGAVLGCLNSTGTVVARDLGMDIDGLSVTVRGDVDYASYLGEETRTRPGLQGLDVEIVVDTAASDEIVATWLTRVEERCPVTDNVENHTPIELSVEST